VIPRKRITAALVGLVALVVGTWLVQGLGGDDTGGSTGTVPGITRQSDPAPAESSGPAEPGDAVASVPGAESGLPVRPLSALPPEAAHTWELIQKGGPFPYSRDGIVFGNREGILPRKPSGYYHEYTVPTPGSPDRGARRLVTGEGGEVYYTADHYASFVVVDPRR